MLKNIFSFPAKRSSAPKPLNASEASGGERSEHSQGINGAELAAQLLATPAPLMQLTLSEARVIVGYMSPRQFSEGTVLIQEADAQTTDYAMLLLEGEVTVETIVVSRTTPITAAVLGAGSLLGEMGLLDGQARSARCTATTEVRTAILTRGKLESLISEHPAVGAKLMVLISLRLAERLRDTADKLKLYTQLTQAMQQEIDRLIPT
jgi:CRP/FNR family transcriptional regulator, cyclic AMP receptor protein